MSAHTEVTASSGSSRPTFRPLDEVRVDPHRARVYEEGWQSWSPTTWYPVGATSKRPTLDW